MTGLIRTSAKALTGAGRSVSKGGKKITKATIPNEIEFGVADRADKFAQSSDKKAGQIRFGPRTDTTPQAPVIPLPDEEAIKLTNRRRRARRPGGRASTVLSGGDADTVG